MNGLVAAFVQYNTEKKYSINTIIENYKEAWKAIMEIGT